MGNFAENLNLGNRFRPPLPIFSQHEICFFPVKIIHLVDPKQISVVSKSEKQKKKKKERKKKKKKKKKVFC